LQGNNAIFHYGMKSGLRNAIWRSRAIAIVGFVTMLLVIFPGLPGALKATLFFVFGFLAFVFGLAGSRHKSYAGEAKPKVIEQVEVEIETVEDSAPVFVLEEPVASQDEAEV